MDTTVICRPFASSTSQGPPVTEHDALSRQIHRDHHEMRARTQMSLRWALIHAIGEYAAHIGQADLIRERIDGKADWW